MTNTQRAREMAEKMCGPNHDPILVQVARTFLDAAWRDGVEAAARECQGIHDKRETEGASSNEEWKAMTGVCLGALRCRDAIRAMLTRKPRNDE